MTFSLALSGGGLLGAAHLGVLKALDEAGLIPEAVAGTSAGGLIAAVLALGVPVGQIIDLGNHITRQPWEYFSLNLEGVVHAIWPNGSLPATGLVDPGRFVHALLDLAPWAHSTADWRYPCAVTAVDLASLTPVAFTRSLMTPPSTGHWRIEPNAPLSLALSATMALPGLFSAPRADNQVLVDGGTADTLPVDWAFALKAAPVIAVDVAQAVPESPAYIGIAEVVARSEAYATEALSRLRDRHIRAFTLAPDTRGVPFFGFKDFTNLVEIGYQTTKAALADLLRFLDTETDLHKPSGLS